jgi:tetratricopeptide (TPR) repeat protein
LQQRGARQLELPPLNENERDGLIRISLERYSKRLDPGLRRRISASPAAGNALYLRLLLEELRVFGDHEQLSSRIAQYLRAPGPLELYLEVLSRLENDYGGPQLEFVPSLLRLLFTSYSGLSEAELLTILSTHLGSIDAEQFWPLYLALHEALISQGGRLTFANQQVRDAVAHRYLSTRSDQDATRRQLVRYFAESAPTERKLDELPWQFMQLEDVGALRDYLMTPELLRQTFHRSELIVLSYWSWLESHSQYRLQTAYIDLLEPSTADGEIAAIIAVLLQQSGYAADALTIWSKLGRLGSMMAVPQLKQRILREQALILGSLGHYARALELLEQEERAYMEPQDRAALHSCLGNQGVFLRKLSRLDEAMLCHQREETLCRELNDLFGLAASLGNQGSILYDQKRTAEAQRLFTEQERLCRHKGDLFGLRACLGNQATLLFERGKREKALALHREVERICRQLGDRAGLQSCLARQTEVLMELEDYDAAGKLFDEQEQLGLEMGNHLAVATTLELRGTMYLNLGAMAQAAEQYRHAYLLCVEHGLTEPAARLEARIRQELQGGSAG